jgi:hypothetical protein
MQVMEMITFPCTACKFVLKVGADKAGRNAKCSKCGAILKIPAAPEAEAVAPPPPTPKKPADDDDDGDGGMVYQLQDAAPQAEEQLKQAEAAKPKVIQTPGRVATKKQAQITNPEEWRKVGFGAKIIAVGLVLWLAAFVLYRVPLALGMTAGEEFAAAADKHLGGGSFDSGKAAGFDLATFAVGIVAGDSWTSLMLTVARLAQVLSLLAYGPLLAGYVICLAVPDRFGTRLQLKVIFSLALLNIISLIVFKLLPLFGVIRYTLLPFVMPEVAMLEMNAERTESLLGFWLKSPVLEVYLATLLTLLHYLEPAMIATFVHSVGMAVKSEGLEVNGLKAMKLSFSQLFIQAIWLMASVCGTSVVLLWTLRFVYTIAVGFFAYQMIFTITTLLSISAVVEEQLGDEADQPASGQVEDEDEEPEEDED